MKAMICCDYSEAGEHVLHEAQKFLQAFPGVDIHVFTVIDLAVVSVAGVYNNAEMINALQVDANQLGKKAEAIFAGTKIHFSCEVGYPAVAVQNKVSNLGIDLLILGTHGRTGLERLLLGSVAENTLRHVNCNTLIIPVKHQGYEPNTSKCYKGVIEQG